MEHHASSSSLGARERLEEEERESMAARYATYSPTASAVSAASPFSSVSLTTSTTTQQHNNAETTTVKSTMFGGKKFGGFGGLGKLAGDALGKVSQYLSHSVLTSKRPEYNVESTSKHQTKMLTKDKTWAFRKSSIAGESSYRAAANSGIFCCR